METSTLFFILAGLLIAILIGYSLWSARREKSRVFSNTFSTRPASIPVGSQAQTEIPETLKAEGFNSTVQQPMQNAAEQLEAHKQEIDSQVREISIKLPHQEENVVQQTQQPIFTQPETRKESYEQPKKPFVQESVVQPVEEPATPEMQNYEPVEEQSIESEPHNVVNNGIVTLYVVAPEGGYFYGSQVVQQLEALGLQYGEYQIFHRHIDNANSPTLFSVANMMQPGIFDLNNIENFATVGLVFFMHLPSPTNNVATLRMMMNTADSLAQSLGGFVLNDQQQIFDENSRQAYLLQVKN